MPLARKHRYLGTAGGCRLYGRGSFIPLSAGYFAYNGLVYSGTKLPRRKGNFNLDYVKIKSEGSVEEFCESEDSPWEEEYCPISTNKKITNEFNLSAHVRSNIVDCPGVRKAVGW